MRNDSDQQVKFDPGVLDLLACPACQGHLRMEGDRLNCGGCGRRYVVLDGIPVLIAERAEMGN